MRETVNYDIFLARQQDFTRAAEMQRAYRMLKARRKRESAFVTMLASLWLSVYGGLKHLRHAAGSVVAPGHRLNNFS